MCGIAGLISMRRNGINHQMLMEMCKLVRHRGPDDEGYWTMGHSGEWSAWGGADTPTEVYRSQDFARVTPVPSASVDENPHVALGHRRLSIVDLSIAGHQPMCTADRRYWIVYNGEVYNHIELRQALEAGGVVFHSTSDTEVVLEAYRRWGEECLHHFNGMFSFILIDKERRRAFIARDRFGIKPLYLWTSPSGFLAIASEIKQFSCLPGWTPRVRPQVAYDFLNWGLSDHGEATFFEGVVQLRGGYSLTLDLNREIGTLEPKQWYRLTPSQFEGANDSADARFRDLLESAVRLCLRSDLTVGSCLSGGLDSSSIVVLMHKILGAKAQSPTEQFTFSARSHEARFDEGPYIDAVVEVTGARRHDVYPEYPELLGANDLLSWHQDEPFGSTSIYAQWKVFQLAARSGVRVILDGQGADEVLAGYHGFFGARLASLVRTLRPRQALAQAEAMRRIHGYSRLRCMAYMFDYLLPVCMTTRLRHLSGRAPANAGDWIDTRALPFRSRDPRRGARSSVRAFSASQIIATNLPMLLHWEDRNSMAHSVESRVPFLDYRLVEFAIGLPEEMLIDRGVTKRILRSAMQGLLPEKVRLRTDKIGFATPEELWMRGESAPQFIQMVKVAIEQSKGILRPTALDRAREIVEGRRPFSFFNWRLISFGAWMSRFGVDRPS